MSTTKLSPTQQEILDRLASPEGFSGGHNRRYAGSLRALLNKGLVEYVKGRLVLTAAGESLARGNA